MDGRTEDFDDWEMLLPEAESVAAAKEEESVVSTEGLMMLRPDYFTIDGNEMEGYSRSELFSKGGGGSVESDNPSWIDPDVLVSKCDGEARPDSASDRSKLSVCEEKLGLGFVENDHNLVFELENQWNYLEKLAYDASESSVGTEKMIVSDEYVENEKTEFGNGDEVEARGEENTYEVAAEGGEIGKEIEQPVSVEKKVLLWWELPVELVKYCVFRISPVWSISVAAAMVGVFIFRKRMHMMKRKTKALQMKVTMDDKKVDQFRSRAARLNEAFSVVRRVPVIRPSLPAPGATQWPFVSMQ